MICISKNKKIKINRCPLKTVFCWHVRKRGEGQSPCPQLNSFQGFQVILNFFLKIVCFRPFWTNWYAYKKWLIKTWVFVDVGKKTVFALRGGRIGRGVRKLRTCPQLLVFLRHPLVWPIRKKIYPTATAASGVQEEINQIWHVSESMVLKPD